MRDCVRVGDGREGWSRSSKPSRTVREMGGRRVRNLGDGARQGGERRWVDRRENRISNMLDLINQLESNYRLSISYPWFLSSLGQCVVTMALQHTSSSHTTPNPSTPTDGSISICPPDMPDKSCH